MKKGGADGRNESDRIKVALSLWGTRTVYLDFWGRYISEELAKDFSRKYGSQWIEGSKLCGCSSFYHLLLEIQNDQSEGALVIPKLSTDVMGVSNRSFIQISGEQL